MSTAKLRIKSKIYPATKGMLKAGIKAKASVRLYIGDSDNCLVEMNNFLIRARKSDGHLFISPPAEKYEDSSGDTKWFHLVRIAPDEERDAEGGLGEQFNNSVMSAYKKSVKKSDDDDDDDDEPRKKKSKKYRDDDDDDDDEPRKKKSKKRDFDDDDDDDEEEWV